MAWMFAATEQDMTVGMHMHYHYVPPLMPPVPFYPHPAIGMIRDKLCTSVKADNRKAAKTGAKTKVLMPPHMPWTGPLTHGTGKEGTGIQQVWMGAGIGVHPFGGIGFVVLEGKPAAGMLSNCLGCWCTAPGFDMMLPFVGLDFVMVPTRGVSVLYGPAPLALDLFVLLLSLLRDLFDFILSKVPKGFWKDVLSDAFDSIMAGAEVFCDAIEQGASPADALKKGLQATAYTFVDKSLTRATNWVAGKVDKIIPPNSWAGKALDFGLEKGLGTDRKGLLNTGKDKVMGGLDNLTGGFLGDGKKAIAEKDSHFGEAEAPNPVGFITDPMEKFADASNKSANAKYDAWKEQKGNSDAAKQKAADSKKVLNDPNATPEQKQQAKKDFNQAKKDQAAAEKEKAKIGQEMKVDAKHLKEDFGKKVTADVLKEGKESVKDEAKKELGIDKDSAAGKVFDKVVDHGVDGQVKKLEKGADDKKAADMKAWEDGQKQKADDKKAFQQKQAEEKKNAGIEPPKDDRKKEKPLDPQQQDAQAKKALENQDKKDKAKDDKNKALGNDEQKQKEQVQQQKEQQQKEKDAPRPQKKGDAPLNVQEVNAIKQANKEFKQDAKNLNAQKENALKNAKTQQEKDLIEAEHDIAVLDLHKKQNDKYAKAGVHPDEVAQRWGNTGALPGETQDDED